LANISSKLIIPQLSIQNCVKILLILVLVGIMILSCIVTSNNNVFADRLKDPVGVDVDSRGNVFVTEPFEERIQKFNHTGTFIRKWGSQGLDDGLLWILLMIMYL
jgi:hypothetical protein